MEDNRASEEQQNEREEEQQTNSSALSHAIASGFGLPDDVVAVLPSDPFEQLDVARKITSIALATRVSRLEHEAARLRRVSAEKDDVIADLRSQLDALDSSFADISSQLRRADQDKENLVNENVSLSNTVKKLNRDVAKLETFRKTLMKSLQEDGEGSQMGAQSIVRQQMTETSTGSLLGEEDASLPSSKLSSIKTQLSESGSSIAEDAGTRDNTSYVPLRLASYNSTPSFSPPRSPPRLLATRSPARSPAILSNPVSPRRHSISFSTTRGMVGDRSALYSSMPSSLRGSMTSPFDAEAQTGRTRVDGKEFFRQVRSRLSYEQFSAFLTNVKELNAHKQNKEETLRKANDIFGPENKDLYAIFEGLINRNHH